MIADSNFEARAKDITWTALRIVAGVLIAFHGMQKLFGVLADHPQPPIGSQLWIGGAIELFGGLLVAVGFLTRPAAFLLSGTMAVAYFQFHWKLQGGEQVFPIKNGGELPAVYAFVFLAITAFGAG
ncbi:MAG TPA: DoxX family protein, partial [Kofleriaceae bacterium]|nr:DoxX family protein [Kofleriaceae bacterium]